jgi:hypothetical protein
MIVPWRIQWLKAAQYGAKVVCIKLGEEGVFVRHSAAILSTNSTLDPMDDEDWRYVSDSQDRKKIQNRLAQRRRSET